MRMRIKTIQTSSKNFILDLGMEKRTETRIGMEGICITHSAFHYSVLHVHSV